MERKEFTAWNERMFKKYNNERLYRHPNPFIRFIEWGRVRTILGSIRNYPRVVDVGCGEGHLLSRMTQKDAVGVDISETAVRLASKSTKALIIRSYAESLPFSDSYFDAAVCSEVLEHTLEPVKVIKELVRIVRPGGRIVLSIPNEPLINRIKDAVWSLGLFSLLFPDVPRRQDDEWHLHSFDRKMLETVCRGLVDIEALTAVPFPFLPIRYVAVCRNTKPSPQRSDSMLRKPLPDKGGYLDGVTA